MRGQSWSPDSRATLERLDESPGERPIWTGARVRSCDATFHGSQNTDRVVNETNKRFARVENIRRFAILEKELDHDDGELTATQKVRRAMIEKKFARELAIIYQAEG